MVTTQIENTFLSRLVTMATATLDPKIIKKTQETLGKIIKKPPLTDKHLSKPPFRYLHDMFMEITRTTGFFKGLYSGKELDGKGEWSRDEKITFFQKAIDVVGFTTGKVPKARPSKIIAGMEADKTNELLQLIAVAILKKIDSTEAISKVLKGEKPGTTPSEKKGGTKEEEVIPKKSSEDIKKKKEEKENPIEESKVEEKKQELPPHPHTQDDKENENEVNGTVVPPTNSDQAPPPQAPPPPQERPQHRPGTRRKPARERGVEGDNDTLSSEGSNSSQVIIERPSTAKGQRKSIDNEQQPLEGGDNEREGEGEGDDSPQPAVTQNGLVPMPRRPASSRPPAPRVIKKLVTESDEQPGSRSNSGQERKAVPTVIMDHEEGKNEEEEEEEEEELLVQDSTSFTRPAEGFTSKPEGALTKTLMAAKEKFSGEGDKSISPSRSVTITEAQRKREREIIQKEVSKLQSSIQSLSQTANPLGKIMDYVQEDLDSMEQELEIWRRENTQHAEALRREEKITEDELTPLKAQLEELTSKIDEQYDLISASKATILMNDQRIQQMLLSLNSQA